MSGLKDWWRMAAVAVILLGAFLAGLAANLKSSHTENRLYAAEHTPGTVEPSDQANRDPEVAGDPAIAPLPETAVQEILHLRELLGGGLLAGHEVFGEVFDALPLDAHEQAQPTQNDDDREAIAARLRQWARKTMASQARKPPGSPAGEQPRPPELKPSSEWFAEWFSDPSKAGDAASARRLFPPPPPRPAAVAPSWQARSALRNAARQLEETAHLLETQDLYEQADELREAAQRLRQQARELPGEGPGIHGGVI